MTYERKGIFSNCRFGILRFQGWGKGTYKQDEFVNLLNIEVGYKVTPNGYFFSDLGDWHGYGFNNPSKQSLVGGFRGPAFAGERNLGLQWLSDCFEKLSVLEFSGEDAKVVLYGVSGERIPAGYVAPATEGGGCGSEVA